MAEENKEKEEVTEENNNQQDNLQSSDTNTSTGDNMSNDYSDEQSKLNLTQLEQRITSLEQRMNEGVQHVEQPQSTPNDDAEKDVDNQNIDDTDESSSPDNASDGGNSLADIEKILNL